MRILLAALTTIFVLGLVWLLLPESLKLEAQEKASVQAFMNNRAAVSSFESGDLGLALSRWTTALSYNPSEAKLHYNLGLGFQVSQRGPEAESSYGMVLKSPHVTPEEKFAVEYNLGVMAQKNKDVDGALKHYQAALDIEPQSLETKINIELLIQQGGGGGQGQQDQEGDQKQDPKDGEGEGEKDQPPKQYAPNKPQKPQFRSEELTPSDVNKILGELKQQEQRIRAEFGKRQQQKEAPGGNDW